MRGLPDLQPLIGAAGYAERLARQQVGVDALAHRDVKPGATSAAATPGHGTSAAPSPARGECVSAFAGSEFSAANATASSGDVLCASAVPQQFSAVPTPQRTMNAATHFSPAHFRGGAARSAPAGVFPTMPVPPPLLPQLPLLPIPLPHGLEAPPSEHEVMSSPPAAAHQRLLQQADLHSPAWSPSYFNANPAVLPAPPQPGQSSTARPCPWPYKAPAPCTPPSPLAGGLPFCPWPYTTAPAACTPPGPSPGGLPHGAFAAAAQHLPEQPLHSGGIADSGSHAQRIQEVQSSLDAARYQLLYADAHSREPYRERVLTLESMLAHLQRGQCSSVLPQAAAVQATAAAGQSPKSDGAVRHAIAVDMRSMQAAGAQGYPIGPFEIDRSELISKVKMFCQNVTTAGGGAAIKSDGTRSEPGKGLTQRISCTAKGCKFSLAYELTYEGWLLRHANTEHQGHELVQSDGEMLVHASSRKIPEQFDYLGRLLAASNLTAQTIRSVFYTLAKWENLDVRWEYQDIYNRFVRSSGCLDASGFINMLQERNEQTGLSFFFDTDETNAVNRAFVEAKGARDIWGTDRPDSGIRNVLLFDPTFGTNAYGLKLSCFVTVDGNGSTRILAYMVHASEDADDVLWGLRRFDAVFVIKPSTFFTDGGPGIKSAVVTFTSPQMPWDGVAHLLCVFHLSKNFFEHIHPLFSKDNDGWSTSNNCFWLIAKRADYSDARLRDMFAQLRHHVSARGSGKSKPAALEWLDTLCARRNQFAAHYTWSHFSAGCHATSRVEGIIGKLKQMIPPNAQLTRLHTSIDDHEEQKVFRDLLLRERRKLKQAAVVHHYPPFVSELRDAITEYAFEKLAVQVSMSVSYKVEDTNYESDACDVQNETQQAVFRVTKVGSDITMCIPTYASDGATTCSECAADDGMVDHSLYHLTTAVSCSCKYPQCFGSACRHMIAVRIQRPVDCRNAPPLLELTNPRWLKANQVEPIAEAQSNEAASSTCFAAMTAALRKAECRPCALDFSHFDVRSFDGRKLAMKFGNSKDGGWHIGIVRASSSQNEQRNSCKLDFVWSDHTQAEVELYSDTLLAEPTECTGPGQAFRKFTWFLVERLPLTPDIQPGALQNPVSLRGRGRPQATRFAPPAGPTSKRSKR